MSEAEVRLGWGWFWASLGGAAVIAVVAAPDLPNWSIKVLVLFTGIALSIASYYFGWLRLQQKLEVIRTVVVLCLTWAGVLGLAYKVWPSPKRSVVVTSVEVLAYQLGKPVYVNIHFINNTPDVAFNGFWSMKVERDVMVGGGDPKEQRKIEDAIWAEFIETTKERSPKEHVELTLPVGKEKILPEVAQFGDDDTRALIFGTKALYIVGMVRDVAEQYMTPYCAIKTPHMTSIVYCQDHN
jgi:hypothetical protein